MTTKLNMIDAHAKKIKDKRLFGSPLTNVDCSKGCSQNYQYRKTHYKARNLNKFLFYFSIISLVNPLKLGLLRHGLFRILNPSERSQVNPHQQVLEYVERSYRERKKSN